ncbi:hypothetical protein [Bacillus salipaludis]|uniref:hypothetical protein n=1 Tax=Bacillus salipaludis TaxID=2547811 RepID=UPI002E1FE7AF|nr:hypothetical protein [Bacillus salipaludis]
MVYQSIRNLFTPKKSIPFAAITTTLLFSTIHAVKAKALQDDFDFIPGSGTIHDSTSSSPNHLNPFSQAQEFFHQSQDFFVKINAIMNWFNDLSTHIAQWSVNLLSWIYELISALTLQTPLWLFKNTWFADTSLVFSSISIGLIILLTMFESMKQIIKHKHVDFSKIIKRLPIAIIGAGAAPYLFRKTFEILNQLSMSITKIGGIEIRSSDVITHSKLSGLDTTALIGFDIILIFILIPLILQTGRRWFDLITLGVMTPLALSCFIFDNYRHYFSMWWSNIKHLSLIQLVYASFICVMGIFIFGTRNVVDGNGFYMKELVVIGGLWRMANPPNFVLKQGDSGRDVTHMFRDLKNIFLKKTLSPLKKGKNLMGKIKPKK